MMTENTIHNILIEKLKNDSVIVIKWTKYSTKSHHFICHRSGQCDFIEWWNEWERTGMSKREKESESFAVLNVCRIVKLAGTEKFY